jgi:hypothetical protein
VCFEVVFVLLESLSPSSRIFIGSHSLPPLSGSPSQSFKGVVVGHPSDGENLKTSKIALEGLVSLVIK